MSPAPTDTAVASLPDGDAAADKPRFAGRFGRRLVGVRPLIGLVLVCIVGQLLNPDFGTWDNVMNVLTRTAFIGIIAVGMGFVIIGGGIDLSVGSMAALIAGAEIVLMNALAPHVASPLAVVLIGLAAAAAMGVLFGLIHGLLITKGSIEPFIVTLGTLGIFRAVLTWLADGGAITLDGTLADAYAPLYYGSLLGLPVPVWVFAAMALIGGFLLNGTRYGRYVQAIGSNEQVARYAAVAVDRVKTVSYALLGACVGVATVLYVPRLGFADDRAAVGARGDRRGHRRRHRAQGRQRQRVRHRRRRRAAVRHQQYPEPDQHHQRLPQRGGAGRGDHHRGLPAAGAALTVPAAAVNKASAAGDILNQPTNRRQA